jgi:hypothetical protein
MGIFSATHRELAKEAFECVFNSIQLKPCTSNLNQRLKSQITGKILKANPTAGKFVYKNFEIISWIFTIITIVSLLYSAYSVYNFAMYGNCEGQAATGPCIYNQIGEVIVGDGTQPQSCELPPQQTTEGGAIVT